jgi:hypothetical protein
MKPFIVTTEDARHFIVTASNAEAAKSRIATKQEHKSGWTGRPTFVEPALKVSKVEAL